MPLMMVMNAEDFIAAHGGKGKMIRLNPQEWLFPDGARLSRSERDTARGVVFTEPPPGGTLAYLRAVEHYHRTKLSQLEKAFGRMKHALLGGPNYDWQVDLLGPPLADREFEGTKRALRHIRELVLAQRQAVAEIEGEINEMPETKARKADAERRARQDEESRQVALARRSEIEAITID